MWIQILVDFELPMMPEECLGSADRAAQFVYSGSREAPFIYKWVRFSGIGIVPFQFPAIMKRDEERWTSFIKTK